VAESDAQDEAAKVASNTLASASSCRDVNRQERVGLIAAEVAGGPPPIHTDGRLWRGSDSTRKSE
jgi:hypothetical protein